MVFVSTTSTFDGHIISNVLSVDALLAFDHALILAVFVVSSVCPLNISSSWFLLEHLLIDCTFAVPSIAHCAAREVAT
jgi:hypothetical protein